MVDRHQPGPARASRQRAVGDRRARRESPEGTLRELQHVGVVQRSRGAHHEIARSVGPRVVRPQIVLAQSADGLAGAGDLLPQRVAFEQRPLGQVVHVDVPPVLVDLVEDLLEDDLALELHFLEEGPREHVPEHRERHFHAARMDGRVVVAVVPGGDAVQVPAHVLDQRIERPAVRIPGAAAEEQVLEEVGDAVQARVLVAGSGADVGGQHAGVEVRQLDGDDAEPVSQHALVHRVFHGAAHDNRRIRSAQSRRRGRGCVRARPGCPAGAG
jgi:hypothetical protein